MNTNSKPPRFVKKARRWEIVYIWAGKLRRDAFSLNRIKSEKEREKAFKLKLKWVIQLMALHIDPRLPEADALLEDHKESLTTPLPADKNIIEAFEFALKLSTTNRSQRTLESYRSDMNVFKAWLNTNGYAKKKVGKFKKLDAIRFLDYLSLERKTRYGQNLKPRSVENYRLNLITFCNYLVDREMMAVNVFKLCKKVKYRKVKRRALSESDMSVLKAYALEHDRELLLVMMLVYGCLFRPIELGRLKVAYFDLKKQLISLPADQVIKKSEPEDKFKRIPDYLVLPIADHIGGANQKDFFFSKSKLKPGSIKCPKNMIANRFRAARSACGLSKEVILYRFKNTGIDKIIDETQDVWDLMFQASWDDIGTAKEYMERRRAASDKMTKIKSF